MDSRCAFAVSAPGKVILFGEHAVVYGRPAIAASIDLRTFVVVEPSEDEDVVAVSFPSVELNATWSRSELPWPKTKCDPLRPPTMLLGEDVVALQPLLDKLPGFFQKAAALAFLYLYVHICSPETPGCSFYSTTALPVGAGLGSSASFSVALATALLRIGASLPLPQELSSARDNKMLGMINGWAFIGESCIHGNPSGIDNIVSTRGGAVHYQRSPGESATIRPYDNFPPLHMLLTSTGVPRRTAELVGGVASLNELHPDIVAPMLDAVGAVVARADKIILEGADTVRLSAILGGLSLINHGLLVALGVSHSSLERVREATQRLKIGNTKLTGAGGGGCAITIVEDRADRDADIGLDAARLLGQDLGEPYKVFNAMLGGKGVAILVQQPPSNTHGENQLRDTGYNADKLSALTPWHYY